ncbi:Gypsy retrotransposon integrase-like protein 1 [Trichinella murrelli]|uniref:RNA-directed DNA polymerase n=1 Tax=Trichinella murrelli TaxID=144512 RepID=A0A0V0T8B5_9BILA|nr:Gypsy retrotransposon integrase-like protein 1 [Trichinella murrelli]
MDIQLYQNLMMILMENRFPENLDAKGRKKLQRMVRRSSGRYFCLQNGMLMHRSKLKKVVRYRIVVCGDETKLKVLETLHGRGPTVPHVGWNKLFALASSRFFWRNMVKDVREFCKNCTECQTDLAKNDNTSVKLNLETSTHAKCKALASSRFFWRNMVKDVREFCKNCTECQTDLAKNDNTSVKLNLETSTQAKCKASEDGKCQIQKPQHTQNSNYCWRPWE